ncbi:MAG TPA: glycosyltransferase family 2 protein [Chthonomonadaceae bacterium]|nr:glycosyltransferase family 2 protein [Chthonomonadaceae bacterium]
MVTQSRYALESQQRRETVAVVIPTFNVEAIIERCLDNVAWADEIVIVDMFSTDSTVEVCRRYPNVRVFQRKDYIFANVNFGMEQARADWVIRLDSDEVLNPELQRSIQRALENPDPDVSGYYFPSIQHMFGLPMRYGVGLRELCLRPCMFRKGTARYACQAEHEEITWTGTLKVLDGYYEHFTNHTAAEFIRKVNYYTDRDVERADPATLKPPRPWYLWYRAIRMFILYYVQWKGYKDGYLGFFSSLFRGPVTMFIEEAKRWEAWRKYQEQQNQR